MTRHAPLVLAALLLSAGCATSTPNGPSTDVAPASSPAADPATWTKGLCASITPMADAVENQPERPTTNDPGAALDAVTGYLDDIDDGVGASLTQMKDLGPSPVAGGDEFVTAMSGILTKTQEAMGSVQDDLAKVDRSDAAAVKRELTAAGESLKNLGTDFAELGKEVDASIPADSELNRLVAEIPECSDLRTIARSGS